ncbi:MAG: hypothetical protein E6H87_07655 [Chloroflexi bacterium]|nr:MAG: hypothetical protein E6H87_07655 [Chloroflexota bacterium]
MGPRRLIAGSVGTVLVGMLAGYVIAAAAGVFIQDSGLFGASGESPVARTYMLGLLQRDPNSIVGIRPNQSIAQRASELQAADSSRTTAQIQPLSLTYIGGATVGVYSVHIYAVGIRNAQGVDQFFPLALTVYGGKVQRSE